MCQTDWIPNRWNESSDDSSGSIHFIDSIFVYVSDIKISLTDNQNSADLPTYSDYPTFSELCDIYLFWYWFEPFSNYQIPCLIVTYWKCYISIGYHKILGDDKCSNTGTHHCKKVTSFEKQLALKTEKLLMVHPQIKLVGWSNPRHWIDT
jgi:hypothetical protein